MYAEKRERVLYISRSPCWWQMSSSFSRRARFLCQKLRAQKFSRISRERKRERESGTLAFPSLLLVYICWLCCCWLCPRFAVRLVTVEKRSDRYSSFLCRCAYRDLTASLLTIGRVIHILQLPLICGSMKPLVHIKRNGGNRREKKNRPFKNKKKRK